MNRIEQYGTIRAIAEKYDIGAISWMAPLFSGSSADVWRIESEKGNRILKRFSRIIRAIREYQISETLKAYAFAAEILPAKDGECFVFGNRAVYSLQTAFDGEPVNEVNEDILSRAVQILVTVHRVLTAAGINPGVNDRFTLSKCTEEDFEKLPAYPAAWPLLSRIEELGELERRQDACIHGDTGIWNFLVENGEVRLIDFTEARMGSPYPDHAGFIVSALENLDKETARRYLSFYLDACAKAGAAPDPAVLHKAADLCLLRGIYAAHSFENRDRMIQQAMRAYHFFEEVCRK